MPRHTCHGFKAWHTCDVLFRADRFDCDVLTSSIGSSSCFAVPRALCLILLFCACSARPPLTLSVVGTTTCAPRLHIPIEVGH